MRDTPLTIRRHEDSVSVKCELCGWAAGQFYDGFFAARYGQDHLERKHPTHPSLRGEQHE